MSERKTVRFSPDLAASIVFIIFSSAFLFLMKREVYVPDESGINARTFPSIVLSLMLFLSLVMLIKEIVLIVLKKPRCFVVLDMAEEGRAVSIFLILLIYALSISFIGFLIPSIVFPLILCFFLGSRKISHFLIVGLSSSAIVMVFRYILHVRL